MKIRGLWLAGLVFGLVFSGRAFAYQVTGPVLEITDTKIVVQKGREKWEVAKDATTKMSAPVKVGDKVTIEYKMTASNVELKTTGSKASKHKK